MPKPFMVFEDIAEEPQRVLFRFLGVRWSATKYAWLSPLFWWTIGLTVAFLGDSPGSFGRGVVSGIAYGVMLYATNTLHSLGHIAAGYLVGAPMAAVLLTATRDVSLYVRRGSEMSRRPRVGRALGGPGLNLLIGALALLAAPSLNSRWLAMFGLFNVAVGVWTLLPVPTLDGAVLWSGLLEALRRRPGPDG